MVIITQQLSTVVNLHETPVYPSPWKNACYVMISLDQGSPSMINSVADLHRQISVRCMSSARMEFSKGMNRPIGSGSVKRKASPLKYMVMLENGGWDRFPSVTMYSNGSNLMLDADADAWCVHPLRLGGCAHGIVTKTADNSCGVLVGGGGGYNYPLL